MSRIKSEDSSFEPEVVVLYCQHCLCDGADIASESKGISGFGFRSVMMPCSSKIEVSYILKILERGADAVQVFACPVNECRFLVGSSRTVKRVEYIRSLLEQIDIGAARVGISLVSGLSAEKFISLAAERAEAVEPLGANPMKKGESR